MRTDELQTLLVSSKVLEDLFSVTDKTIRNYAEQGIVERATHGKYKFLPSIKGYIAVLKLAGSRKTVEIDGEELDLDAERAAHERLKRQITEIKLQLIQGQVHKAEDVEAVMTDMLERFKAKITSLPGKLAKQLEGEDKVTIQKILQEELYDALKELSEYKAADFYSDEHIEIKDDTINKLIDEVSNEKECGVENSAAHVRSSKSAKA